MSLPKSYASSIHGETPDDALADYKAVFPPEVAKFPYDKQRVNRVMKIRATLGGSLFFDRLCLEHLDKVENIQEEYPPKATSYLKHLFERILQSSIDRLRQHSFVYYLVRDYDEDRARKYSEKALIPEHFVRLMDGIWFLDHLEFEKALPYITHPGVHFPYPDMLLSALHTAQAPAYLTLTYIECANPSLLSDDSILLYFRSLLSISPAQSFLYTRVAPVHLRKQLLRNLVEYYLSSEEENRHKNALILLDLPLTKEEELVVEDVLKRMTGKAASLARDTLWVRWESKGKLGEVLDVAGRQGVENEEKAAGVNWGDLSRGVELGLGGRRVLANVIRN